jgi:hypothetical protein
LFLHRYLPSKERRYRKPLFEERGADYTRLRLDRFENIAGSTPFAVVIFPILIRTQQTYCLKAQGLGSAPASLPIA